MGSNKPNPLAMILSAAMLLEYGLGEVKAAERIEKAMLETLNKGFRTGAASHELQGRGWPTKVRRAKRSYADSAQAGVIDEIWGKSSVDESSSRMEKLDVSGSLSFFENENFNEDLSAARPLDWASWKEPSTLEGTSGRMAFSDSAYFSAGSENGSNGATVKAFVARLLNDHDSRPTVKLVLDGACWECVHSELCFHARSKLHLTLAMMKHGWLHQWTGGKGYFCTSDLVSGSQSKDLGGYTCTLSSSRRIRCLKSNWLTTMMWIMFPLFQRPNRSSLTYTLYLLQSVDAEGDWEVSATT